MTIRKRSALIVALVAVGLGLYAAARQYSPLLVFHVVEQSLIQKAPSGPDGDVLRERFHQFISAAPDKHSQMDRLLRVSEYLEKVQHPTVQQLNELLAVDEPNQL